ncbi:MAG: hypothetical protein SVY53_12135 [Chloroflexota bacterium]|nr:hypothetical protein [Chloroflexota bacterium]
MKEYGWIPWEEWEGMPLLVRDGLIKCLNIDAEYQEAKLEEAKRKQR